MPRFDDGPEVILPERDYNIPHKISYRRPALLVALFLILFVIYNDAVPLYTDWLWFGEVGYRSVFTTTILAKLTLFFLFGLMFFLVFYGNALIARRLAPERADRFLMEKFGPEWGKIIQRRVGQIVFVAAVFFSLWAGRLAVEEWMDWLQYHAWEPFKLTDPVFGNDVGFYVFRLPFLEFVYNFLLGTVVISTIGAVLIHVADTAIESFAGLPNVKPGVRAQFMGLLAALALIQAFGTRLAAYGLLGNDNGIFVGAGYADIHYRLFSMNIEIGLLIITSVACLASMRGKGYRWPVLGVSAWLLCVAILGNLLPGALQKAVVEPNQFGMERQYIQRNIAFTRKGFGLDNVTRIDSFPADNSLTAAGIQANRPTLDNVRLWDYDYLGKVYSQLQTIKPYYKFEKIAIGDNVVPDIDIDRYRIGGQLRQVMLAAREMNTSGLSDTAQTWQNTRLSYTHGYGLAMSPVNRVNQGDPTYFVSDLPVTVAPEAASAIKVTQPDIYYGQREFDYVFVDTSQPEFDYPSTESGAVGSSQDHYTTYTGRGGIRIGDSEIAKLAFSLKLGDPNILLSKGFTDRTRVLFRRDIRERLMTVAPFLQQDTDPYLVIEPASGRLVWVLDCYTESNRFPYSRPQELPFNSAMYIAPNYIRNSVKATVDAYDGSVKLYIVDSQDPIARTYARIFPDLFKSISEMPQGLKAHLRYPEDMFRMQRDAYAAYHVDDPHVFYLKEDAWAAPFDANSDAAAGAAPTNMEPYYVIMKLPGADANGSAGAPPATTAGRGEEFLLMSPLAPINREGQNILGWMCARCDPGHYGELVLYRFPQSASVAGPSQVVQLINSDRVISPQLSLLRQGGSSAKLGNLLVIPVEHSLLYIAPLYVEASDNVNKLPQLQKVIVEFSGRTAMEDTLDKALSDLFPGGANNAGASDAGSSGRTSEKPTSAQSSTLSMHYEIPPAVRYLIETADSHYRAAQDRLSAKDLAGYAAEMKQVDATLGQLRAETAQTGHR